MRICIVQEHVDRIRMGKPGECVYDYDVSPPFFSAMFAT